MLEQIKTTWLNDVAALIAKYPAQEGNRSHYEEIAASMKLGELSRRVKTKLNHFPRGTRVGYVLEEMDGERVASFYAVGISDRAMLTSVPAEEMISICSTCSGAQVVLPHPMALVGVFCPGCS